ncbi:MAG: thioredoxin family protein [Beijerinckiaceae bacterium]|nr:thioredoxin family protein [Beijerinckiaceae bacterium]
MLALATIAPALAGSLELVMFERAGCPHCARWDREVAPAYPLTPEGAKAPLRRVKLESGQTLQLSSPVRFSPTFVLLSEGREVGRITGYMDEAMFWGLFSRLLKQAEAPAT